MEDDTKLVLFVVMLVGLAFTLPMVLLK